MLKLTSLKTWRATISQAVLGRLSQWRLSRLYPLRMPNESVGSYGEKIAAIFLQRQGYLILERSYRIKS